MALAVRAARPAAARPAVMRAPRRAGALAKAKRAIPTVGSPALAAHRAALPGPQGPIQRKAVRSTQLPGAVLQGRVPTRAARADAVSPNASHRSSLMSSRSSCWAVQCAADAVAKHRSEPKISKFGLALPAFGRIQRLALESPSDWAFSLLLAVRRRARLCMRGRCAFGGQPAALAGAAHPAGVAR